MSSQNSRQNSSQLSKSLEKQMLLEEMSNLELQMSELMKKLNLMEKYPKKITLFVIENKEQIAAKKTQKQLDVENNSLLFKRKNISHDKLYHPYRTGVQTKEKRYIDMFNYVLVPLEGRREGKVKYINQCLNLNDFKQEHLNDKSKESLKPEKKKDAMLASVRQENNKKSENDNKIILALNKKKVNDLRITARDMKIKNYSVMKKDELVKSIFDILKQKEKETSVKVEKQQEEKKNSNTGDLAVTKKSKSELLKECGVDDSVDYDENDLNGNNDENLFYDDDDHDEDSVDYE